MSDLSETVSISNVIRASLLSGDADKLTDAICDLDEYLTEYSFLSSQNVKLLQQVVKRRWDKVYLVMVALNILDEHTDEVKNLLDHVIDYYDRITFGGLGDENCEGDQHLYSPYLSRKLLLHTDFLDEKNLKKIIELYNQENDNLSELDLAALLYIKTGKAEFLKDLKKFLNDEEFVAEYAQECLALI